MGETSQSPRGRAVVLEQLKKTSGDELTKKPHAPSPCTVSGKDVGVGGKKGGFKGLFNLSVRFVSN